jgi:hypothetical protein
VLYGLALTAFPIDSFPLGLTVGVQGEEEIAQELMSHSKRTWGYLVGARIDVYKGINIGAYWAPGYEKPVGKNSTWVNDQFRFSLLFTHRFGLGHGGHR